MDHKAIGREVSRLALVILGTALISFATAVFLIPFDIVMGGVSGFAIALAHLGIGDAETVIAISVLVFFLIGWISFGKDFFARTFVSSMLYPPLTALFSMLRDERFFGGYFILEHSSFPDAALICSAVFGGGLVGLGCSLSFIGGGSTGGLDVAALLASRRFSSLGIARSMLIIDLFVVLFGAVAIADPILTMLGIISAAVCSFAVDKTFFVKKQ
jgi:uncharacterized membrane-anchored protein YitT (DUF2179 family)